jgi:polyisoprenoid-binding protein YceI
MKSKNIMKAKIFLFALLAVTVLGPNASTAQNKVKAFKMTIQGTSSLHDWESVIEKLECKASYTIEQNTLTEIKEAIVKIPVRSIKSPKGKMMDNKTYEAFDYEKNPTIIFALTSVKTSASVADLKGTLTMAGAGKSIDLRVTYKILANGDLQITGMKKIKMSDFKMEPPTAMMGTIKVGDEVTVNFELTLSNGNTIL